MPVLPSAQALSSCCRIHRISADPEVTSGCQRGKPRACANFQRALLGLLIQRQLVDHLTAPASFKRARLEAALYCAWRLLPQIRLEIPTALTGGNLRHQRLEASSVLSRSVCSRVLWLIQRLFGRQAAFGRRNSGTRPAVARAAGVIIRKRPEVFLQQLIVALGIFSRSAAPAAHRWWPAADGRRVLVLSSSAPHRAVRFRRSARYGGRRRRGRHAQRNRRVLPTP